MGPLAKYQQLTNDAEITQDSAQFKTVQALQVVYQELIKTHALPNKLNQAIRTKLGLKIRPVQGLYIWGDVGRGKTFLVDLFYDCLPFENKIRLHFHRFMNRVHADLKQLPGVAEPLQKVAQQLAKEARIICFDEFFVSDITDAMLLAGLLKHLFHLGVTLVATSNIPPNRLYENGLQRQQFLPAIDLIEKNMQVFSLESDTDYRMRTLSKAEMFYLSSETNTRAALTEVIQALAPHTLDWQTTIEVLNRDIAVIAVADDVVWFDFAALCDGPRSQADYIELSRCYHTVLLSDMPVFHTEQEEQARRFIALVDELYDRRVKLILSAPQPLVEVYQGERLKFEFRRTLSRLTEMQSHEYLAEAHRP